MASLFQSSKDVYRQQVEALESMAETEEVTQGLGSKSEEEYNWLQGFMQSMKAKRAQRSSEIAESLEPTPVPTITEEDIVEFEAGMKSSDTSTDMPPEFVGGRRTTFDSSPTPEALKQPSREEAPSVDTSSNKALDKPPADAPDAKTPMPAPPEVKEGSIDSFITPEYKVFKDPKDMSDLEILARTIEAEAANEAYEGKMAVGSVIANRAASGKHGKGIKGVILKRGQFSPWNSWTGYAEGEQGKDMMKLKPSEASYRAANDILTGSYEDVTKGATHYANPDISKPKWLPSMKGQKRGTIKIGNHLFGNADSNKTYDGLSWVLGKDSSAPKTSKRPKARPTGLMAAPE